MPVPAKNEVTCYSLIEVYALIELPNCDAMPLAVRERERREFPLGGETGDLCQKFYGKMGSFSSFL